MIKMMMMITQNDHYLTNFQAMTSRFCIIIDLNDTYRMTMMKTQNDHSSANFQVKISRFCMVTDLNDT